MQTLHTWLGATFELHIEYVILIALAYILIHYYRNKSFVRYFDIILNYIPVLTHEMGHILFNKIGGGKARDLVIVVRPSERIATSQQGYAVTQSSGTLGHVITTLGGYVMPPIMLGLGFLLINSQYPNIFIVCYLIIFSYFLFLTSRKAVPILVVLGLIGSLYLLLQQPQNISLIVVIAIVYHFFLGTLLGEVLQSTWTIVKLTLARGQVSWDGTTLNELTRIPTFVFTFFWIVVNLFSLYYITTHYL